MYDQYGIDGANAADQMPDGHMPGGFGFPPGGGGGVHHMSSEDAQNLFSSFFGGSDPFGGMGGGMGGMGRMPGMSFSMGGMPPGMGRGGPDPISMMFQNVGGMPGMANMGGMPAGMGNMGGMPGMAGMSGMPGMRTQQSPPQIKRYDSIPSGTVVSLKGLVNAADRNGGRGVVQQFIPSTSRYVVQLEDSNQTMSVKPSNLLQHCKVRIHGLQSQPELNGKSGTIIAWNETKQRYNIYIIVLKKALSLKASNVILDNQVVAQINGIIAKPELNGKWGTIINWIRETNKYDIQLSPQQVVRIKAENVRV